MRKRVGQSDADICMSISGNDDIEHAGGITVVDDYFRREYEENRRAEGLEQVYKVPLANGEFVWMLFDPDAGRSEREIAMWRHDKWLEELEQKRTNREIMEYPHDWENDVGIFLPKPRVTEVV